MVINVHAWNCLGRYYMCVSTAEDLGNGKVLTRSYVCANGPVWPDEDPAAICGVGEGVTALGEILAAGIAMDVAGWTQHEPA